METYNGWTNWETWNVNLWLTNDENTYSAIYRLGAEEIETYWIKNLDGTDGIDSDRVNWNEIFDGLQ